MDEVGTPADYLGTPAYFQGMVYWSPLACRSEPYCKKRSVQRLVRAERPAIYNPLAWTGYLGAVSEATAGQLLVSVHASHAWTMNYWTKKGPSSYGRKIGLQPGKARAMHASYCEHTYILLASLPIMRL